MIFSLFAELNRHIPNGLRFKLRYPVLLHFVKMVSKEKETMSKQNNTKNLSALEMLEELGPDVVSLLELKFIPLDQLNISTIIRKGQKRR